MEPILVWTVALTVTALSLTLRILHRGLHFAGFEVVGAASGMARLAKLHGSQLLKYYAEHQFDSFVVWNTFGVPVSLLPGRLAAVVPWDYWPQLTTFSIAAASTAFVCFALGLSRTDLWMPLLAWGSSAALMSYAVFGFPYLSGVLPYGLALLAVNTNTLGTSFGLSVGAILISWHVQELGRTVFVVFLAAAVLLPRAGLRSRLLWFVIGVLQLWLAASHHSFNTMRFATLPLPTFETLPLHAVKLARHVLAGNTDIPVLLPGAAFACTFVPQRAFWLVLLGFHGFLVLLLASGTGTLVGLTAVWPRRLLVLNFLAVTVCILAMKTGGRGARPVTILMIFGSLLQLAYTATWVSTPLRDRGEASVYPLPYVHTPVTPTQHLDCKVALMLTDWYLEVRDALARGRTVLVVYNLSSYDENSTDPAGILDRLYLLLGHDQFRRSVLVFGEDATRWYELPITPMKELRSRLEGISDPTMVDGYWLHHPWDDHPAWESARRHRAEIHETFTEVARLFSVTWKESMRDSAGRTLYRFSLRRN